VSRTAKFPSVRYFDSKRSSSAARESTFETPSRSYLPVRNPSPSGLHGTTPGSSLPHISRNGPSISRSTGLYRGWTTVNGS
jgi:hypothetical protein